VPGSSVLAQIHVERGQLLYLGGNLEDALEAYEAALKARPQHAPAHRGRGEILFRLKRYTEAIQAFTAYLKSDGAVPTVAVYQPRVLAHIRLNDPKSAVDDLTLALHLKPDDPALLTQRGQAFLACQNDQQQLALYDFDQAIRWNPKNGPAYSGRARALIELG